MLTELARLLVVAAAMASCASSPVLDLSTNPRTLGRTVDSAVGDRFSLGMHGPSLDPRTGVDLDPFLPIRITAIEVIASSGVEILGVGVHGVHGEAVGFSPGWPPDDRHQLLAMDDEVYATAWNERVSTVVGYELTAETAGIRGIKVSWTNSRGEAHSRVFDIASLTCPPTRCESDEDIERTLVELGLLRR